MVAHAGKEIGQICPWFLDAVNSMVWVLCFGGQAFKEKRGSAEADPLFRVLQRGFGC